MFYIRLASNHNFMSYHLRAGKTSTPTPSHPEPASHNRSLSTIKCIREGDQGSPFFCSREECQHRRSQAWCISSGNHQLQREDWAGLTPVPGRAAQAWPALLSGSWGSSSTKPLISYLVNMVGGIQELLTFTCL